MRQIVFLILLPFSILNIQNSVSAQIVVNAAAEAKSIRMSDFGLGYHHNAMYYDRSTAYKKAHDIMKQSEHKRPFASYWRSQNLFTYRNDPKGPDGLRSITEQRSGHSYDTERYAGTGGFNWTKVDEVFDEIVNQHGMIPIVEFNFMPECMAENPSEIGAWDYAIISPPKDYNEWVSLIRNTVSHFQNRYGASATKKWFWGVWNEPDHSEFWNRDISEFYKLYDYSAEALKSVDNELAIGGPDFAGYESAQGFIQHTYNGKNYYTERTGAPFDYVSIHAYKLDARAVCKKVWDFGQYVKNAYGSGYSNKKILLTETAPHWSMDMEYFQTRYTATWLLGVVDLFLEAADIHGEFYLPEAILYCGILRSFGKRSLLVQTEEDNNSDQVLKTAPFNAYEMLSLLSEERIPVQGCDFPANFLDIERNLGTNLNQLRCIATRTAGKSIELLVYHRNDDDRIVYNELDDKSTPALYGTYYREIPVEHNGTLIVNNVPFKNVRYKKYVIDQDHSNSYAYRAFHNKTESYTILNQHDDLEQTENKSIVISDGQYVENFEIQQNALMLIVLENENPAPGALLGTSQASLDFGNQMTTMSLSIYNSGDQALTWSATENPEQSWITSIIPSSGSLSPGKSETVNMSVQRNLLADGEYSGTVLFSSNGGNKSVDILMKVGSLSLPASYRINAGGSRYTDSGNKLWSADQAYAAGGYGYFGGMISDTQDEISRTVDDALFRSERYKMQAYRFEVANGNYEVLLHFAEIYFEAVGRRVMTVSIEGESKLIDLDIFKEVGHDAALTYRFQNIAVNDGRLDIEFASQTENAKVSAIEVMKQGVDNQPPQSPRNVRVIIR